MRRFLPALFVLLLGATIVLGVPDKGASSSPGSSGPIRAPRASSKHVTQAAATNATGPTGSNSSSGSSGTTGTTTSTSASTGSTGTTGTSGTTTGTTGTTGTSASAGDPPTQMCCTRPENGSNVCPCGDSCMCGRDCWCHQTTSGGDTSGSTNGSTGGNTAGSSAGNTGGNTDGSSGGYSAGTSAGTDSGDTGGYSSGTTSGTDSGTTGSSGGTNGSSGGTNGSSGGTNGSSGGTNGTSGGTTGGEPPIGTPPRDGDPIAIPDHDHFMYPSSWLGVSSIVSSQDGYWNWYWYTYCHGIPARSADGHPHPPAGVALPYWLDRPYWSGSNLAFTGGAWWSFYGNETLNPSSASYAYWKNYATDPGGGSGGGTGTSGTTGGQTPPSPPTPDPGTGAGTWSNADWIVSITSYQPPSKLVSGTNVELAFEIHVASKWKGDRTVKPRSAIVTGVQFVIGNEIDPTPATIAPSSTPVALPGDRFVDYAPLANDPSKPQQSDGIPPDYVYRPRVRFASTQFKDGEAIPVHAVLSFSLQGDGAPVDQTPLASPTLTFTACNKALAFATKLYADCTNGYQYDNDMPPKGYFDWDSRNAILGTRSSAPTSTATRTGRVPSTCSLPRS